MTNVQPTAAATNAADANGTPNGTPDGTLAAARAAVRAAIYGDEEQVVADLLEAFPLTEKIRRAVQDRAGDIVRRSRAMKEEQGTLDAFLAEFGLSNQEGVALMCLAEALLRVPDSGTQDALIAEKIRSGDWAAHKGQSDSLFVNASTWALMLTGEVVQLESGIVKKPGAWVKSLVSRLGEPVIRTAVKQAMRIMGRQFVFGRTIDEALERCAKQPDGQRLMSFDMLGEGARTMAMAERYAALYGAAIETVGRADGASGATPHDRSSVSIKLSALHPRYEDTKAERILRDLLPVLKDLALKAKQHGIQLTIDAEEADRLDLSLTLIEALARDPELAGWDGLGLAVQAYQKRSAHVIDWVVALARETGRRIPVRLVKGAYWDTEIKHAQEMGLPDYPVFTRKAGTDVNYLYTAARMLEATDVLYPQFATHNAHTIAAIAHMGTDRRYEFQRLHGMGALLYKASSAALGETIKTRIYAPVGLHEDLLPYLVRRLLENGANSSFVNRFMDADVPVEAVSGDPVTALAAASPRRHPAIPVPAALYGDRRRNSAGCNLMDPVQRASVLSVLDRQSDERIEAACLVAGQAVGAAPQPVVSPVDTRQTAGTIRPARPEDLEAAVTAAAAAQPDWDARGGAARAAVLRAIADRLEDNRDRFLSILAREAGKTLEDGIAEVREAVDFCRYYAGLAEDQFEGNRTLPGPTGERNELSLGGRGVFLCISPWNFPLAIFTGQVAAALAAGNAVLAKPAEQTPLVAHMAVTLMHAAGVPGDVLHLLAGDGAGVGGALVGDPRVAGVAFTGSTVTAQTINRALAARKGAIVPLIAETGGQNAMIVDSTALLEQVSDDVMMSAFGSAGQRCSALRVLFVQDDVADALIDMLKGALAERRAGDPADPATDIGPIIDDAARQRLADHCAWLASEGRLVAQGTLPDETAHGTYLAPHIFTLDRLDQLEGEVFGPVLHIIRYKADDIDDVLAQIGDTGFGLTFGVHTRLESRWRRLFARARVGNTYINRNMIGAVVGVQPFGGEGLSGTGPKAGGPHYLLRFAVERTLTVNTAAIGGNADLFSLSDA
ncbi:bifunctional proline dehydrogenase/L-glutamate gamma-semialdehyde dehydrogenase PutA [Eilatimonas milleporae]|uniref:Bifunctional protein PutA n=1 Tax=Eilatimonas milleporae TaxID=911205 RepID=A0A3M0C7G0_9PROT|nr:bifunctional proline dehydrogenase/L-glutamate gamma-semialdehyde dehydrogenase PutA [Eilatimonas milleporae]RMB04637.1 L-proline dehydrogenase /delta-1-pyrroline-5-carboxylate dehydrogenase [Eilatimonas milleporae]